MIHLFLIYIYILKNKNKKIIKNRNFIVLRKRLIILCERTTNHSCKTHTIFFFYYKVFVLGITMQLDISTKLTPQVTTIICHHMKKNIIKKKEKRKKIQKYGGTRPKPIC